MALEQFLGFGFFDPQTVGRMRDRPLLSNPQNLAFEAQVAEMFDNVINDRDIPENYECDCKLKDENVCQFCRQPYRNESGVLSVFLWRINRDFGVVEKLENLMLKTCCEVVHYDLFSSHFVTQAHARDELHYYSGPVFRAVLDDWERFSIRAEEERRLYASMNAKTDEVRRTKRST